MISFLNFSLYDDVVNNRQFNTMMMAFYHFMQFLLLCTLVVKPVGGFGILESFKLPTLLSKQDNGITERRENLKQKLLEACKTNDRSKVEAVISELSELSPTPNSANSPLLQKKWLLEWTTEKEINFFINWDLCAEITQVINGPLLENCIPFKRGGYLGVKGSLTTAGGPRTNFEFTEATLDLGSFGSFKIPPVGKGWFDTVYLDEDLRVDTNSRDDILICSPARDSM
jgi:hypothetical protein